MVIRRSAGRARHVATTVAATATLVLAGTTFIACDDDEQEAAAPETCASMVDRAARASEVREQVDLLDAAIVACREFAALEVELRRHPGIIAFDTETFVDGRCERSTDETVTSSPICTQTLAGATTTSTTIVELVYEGLTLDGRTIQITERDVPFVEGKPEPIIRIVDIAIEDGCEALAAERANWEARIDDPTVGDQASVYAQHADNVATFVGCTAAPTTD